MISTWCSEKAANGFKSDGETKRKKKDSVYEGSEDLGTVPAIRVSGVNRYPFGELEEELKMAD